jgi:DNA-binding GntR family transcriptional regulator
MMASRLNLVLALPVDARRLDERVLSDHVHAALRDAICDGSLGPYTRLVQTDIAERLGVSRTPVREACIRLAQEGLVRAVPGRGFVVLDVTDEDILQVYQVRLALELMAVELLSFPLEPGVTGSLRMLHETIAGAAPGSVDYYELNRRFHMTLVSPTPNRLAVRILGELWEAPMSVRIFKRYVGTGLNVKRMNAEHGAIVKAVERADKPLVLELLRRHLTDAQVQTQAWLKDQAGAAESAVVNGG